MLSNDFGEVRASRCVRTRCRVHRPACPGAGQKKRIASAPCKRPNSAHNVSKCSLQIAYSARAMSYSRIESLGRVVLCGESNMAGGVLGACSCGDKTVLIRGDEADEVGAVEKSCRGDGDVSSLCPCEGRSATNCFESSRETTSAFDEESTLSFDTAVSVDGGPSRGLGFGFGSSRLGFFCGLPGGMGGTPPWATFLFHAMSSIFDIPCGGTSIGCGVVVVVFDPFKQ